MDRRPATASSIDCSCSTQAVSRFEFDFGGLRGELELSLSFAKSWGLYTAQETLLGFKTSSI